MAGEVIVDALPYIDQGYEEPGVRDAVSNRVPFLLQLNKISSVKNWRIYIIYIKKCLS